MATGSPRRRALLAGASTRPARGALRGNMSTRLAAAGRNGVDADGRRAGRARTSWRAAANGGATRPLWFVPQVGQGALALEARSDDATTRRAARPDQRRRRLARGARRARVPGGARGGLLDPRGAHAEVDGASITLHGVMLAPDGTKSVRGELVGDDPVDVGRRTGSSPARRSRWRRALGLGHERRERRLDERARCERRPACLAARRGARERGSLDHDDVLRPRGRLAALRDLAGAGAFRSLVVTSARSALYVMWCATHSAPTGSSSVWGPRPRGRSGHLTSTSWARAARSIWRRRSTRDRCCCSGRATMRDDLRRRARGAGIGRDARLLRDVPRDLREDERAPWARLTSYSSARPRRGRWRPTSSTRTPGWWSPAPRPPPRWRARTRAW